MLILNNSNETLTNEQKNYGKLSSIGFVNTQYFRERAIYYEKHNRYPDGVPGTAEFIEYWDEEHRRVEEGYSVGGVKITGEHYLYLNYLPILRIPDEQRKKGLTEGDFQRVKVTKELGFPQFWDEDYIIYKSWEIAENGITLEELNRLPIDIPLEKDAENLAGGHHHLWLKPRGVGASYKGAVRPIKRQFFHKNESCFIIANSSEYLQNDGIYDKYLLYKNFLNANCRGFARNFSINGTKDMHFRASYWVKNEDTGLDEEKGKRSSVYGITLDGQPQKARGKRGYIIWEEFGSNSIVDTAWIQARNSVEEDGYVYAMMMGFGTGGDDKGGMIPLTKMFYNPRSYNILRFRNIWDDIKDKSCAYFTPSYISVAHKDKDGNSDKVKAKKFFDSERAILEKSSDKTVLPKFQAEKPYNPKEALRTISTNKFPILEIEEQLKYLESTNIDLSLVKTGTLKHIDKRTVQFEINTKLSNYDSYPVNLSDSNIDSCVCILHSPFRMSNIVPKGLYRISVDAYKFDNSTGDSIGSIYVIENSNKYTSYKGDKIVAWYNGRPKKQDEFNANLYMLAVYYNAEIAFENDEPGDIVSYGKIKRVEGYPYMNYLAEEFELAYDDNLRTPNAKKREFGIRMNTGRNRARIIQGNAYITEWLLRPRLDGLYNYQTVMDRGLLRELLGYYDDGNFDRISSLRVNMYHEREYLYNNVQVKEPKKDNFFNEALFQD